MIFFKFCVFFALFSISFSKMDLNFHLDDMYNSLSNETFVWSTLKESIKLIVDAVLQPNLVGIYKMRKILGISSDCFESLQSLIMSLRVEEGWAIRSKCCLILHISIYLILYVKIYTQSLMKINWFIL